MYTYKICPAGMTCDYNRTAAPDLENDACVMGYYCLSGDKVGVSLGIREIELFYVISIHPLWKIYC